MNNKEIAFLCVVSLGLGAGVSRVFWQRTVTETKTVTVDHVVTQTHTVIKPDGTKIIDSTKTKDENKTKDQVKSESKERYWRVSAGRDSNNNYIGVLEYKALGPIVIGVIGSTNGSVAGTIGVEF